jgi:uncharacterized protein YbjT (DUF2867 family)
MRVVIAGGHGQVALLLESLLVEAGHQVVGLVRNPAHVPDLRDRGAEAVVLDLEGASVDAVADSLAGADAVVFAAGAGPGSGAARKATVDRDAAILVADAAERAGVQRYAVVSAMGVDRADPASDEVFEAYLRAKAAADADIRARQGLEWTIVRPGGLTDDPGTGRVQLGEHLEPGRISRADVAALLLAVLESPQTTSRRQFDAVAGQEPIRAAVGALPVD